MESFIAGESRLSLALRGGMPEEKVVRSKKSMIVVPVKEGENIERALKKFKRKFEKTGVVKELRSRQQFDKPSVLKRLAKERAVYVQKMQRVEE